jgi:hypothetical protein
LKECAAGTVSTCASPTQFAAVDPLIRELVQYRDLINHRTKELEE